MNLQCRTINAKKSLSTRNYFWIYFIGSFIPIIILFLHVKLKISGSIFFITSLVVSLALLIVTTLDQITNKPYLAFIFGCHTYCERSIRIFKYQLPICARCTGIFIGILFSVLYFFLESSILISFILGVPLIVDGLLQKLTRYSSNNYKRFFSGVLFGPSIILIISGIVIIYIFVYNIIN